MATSRPLIRPPLQRRSQESLQRLLDAGLEVLNEHGFEGFTIQAVSQRSGLSTGAIYTRVSGREDLIMAIYEHAMEWVGDQEQAIEEAASRRDLGPRVQVQLIATEAGNGILQHGDVMRVFFRQAPLEPEIWERGSKKSRFSGRVFCKALLQLREHIPHRDPELVVDVAWRMLYSTLCRRVTHGPTFESSRPVSDEVLVQTIARAIADFLVPE